MRLYRVIPDGEEIWQWWLSQIPCDIDQAAVGFGALQRRREIQNGQTLLRLLLAYCATDMSFRQTAAWSAITGLAQISDVSLIERFERCEPWLAHLLAKILQQDPKPIPEHPTVSLVDATHITSADGKTWRLHMQWIPQQGIEQVTVSDATVGESFTHFTELAPSSLLIADRGYAPSQLLLSPQSLRCQVLCRIRSNLFKLPGNQSILALANPQQIVDVPITYPQQVSGRLLLIPKPPDILEKAQQKEKRNAQKKQKKWSPQRQKASQYLIFYTNNLTFPAQQLLTLYRYRWQIELLFKRMKSLQGLDQTRLKSPVLCRVYILVHLIVGALAEKMIAKSRYSGLFPPQVVEAAFCLAALSVGFSQFTSGHSDGYPASCLPQP